MSADISTILNFEGHALTFLDHACGELLIRASDLALPMEVTPDAIRMQVRQLQPEDVHVSPIYTNKGSRQANFLTRSGALQLLATGRSEKCRRLRKVICDFFVEYMDGKHRGLSDVRPLLEEVARLGQAVAVLGEEIAQLKLPALRPLVHNNRRWGKSSLNLWTPQAEARCLRDGFTTARAYLTQINGAPTGGPKAGGLTTRTVNLCRRNKLEVRLLVKSGQTLTLLPQNALRAAHLRDTSQLLLTGTDSGQLLLSATSASRG